MKPANSAFSHPAPRSGRRVSIRSTSVIIGRASSSSGDSAQKRDLQAVEEEDASIQNFHDSPQGSIADSGAEAAAASSGDSPASFEHSAAQPHGFVAENQTAPFSSSPGCVASLDTPAASSTMAVPIPLSRRHTHSGSVSAIPEAENPESVPLNGHIELSPVTAAATTGADNAGGRPSLTAANVESTKRNIEQFFSTGIHARMRRAGNRAENPAAEAAVRGEQRTATPAHGWVDKVKRNIVGFFEGGDSDPSSSDDETANVPAEVHALPSDLNEEYLLSVIAAVKAADPAIVHDHKKNSLFALSSDVLQLTFRGSALVDWLIDRSKAGKFAVQGRAQAVVLGEAMCSCDLIRNVEKGPAGTIFKDADVLFRFDCDEQVLKEQEASKAAAAGTKGFSHFRTKFTGISTPAFKEGEGVASPSSQPSSAALSSIEPGSSSNSSAGTSDPVDAPYLKERFSEQSSSHASHAVANRGSLRSSVSRFSSLEARESVHISASAGLDVAPAAVHALKTATEARISAVESRASHLRAQMDRMLALMEQKDIEIQGKLRDIEALRLELKDECSETHEGLVAIQAIWDEKNPIFDKVIQELPLLDAKINDFEKRHEEAKDKVDEVQQRLRRFRDQQSEVLAGGGKMTWNDWFMSWGLVISMFFIKWFFAILTKLRLYKPPAAAKLQDADRAKVDNAEIAGAAVAIPDNDTAAPAQAAAGGVLDAAKPSRFQKMRGTSTFAANGAP